MDENTTGAGKGLSREQIGQEVVKILTDMTDDWDVDFSGDIGPATRIIADLQFESIDVVQFVVQIESKFQRKKLPFEKLLMVNERYRDDFTVEEVVEFLHINL